MQKVVGSNPISRFASIPLHFGRLALPGEIKPPHIADARIAAISADSASLPASGGATVASAKT